MEDFSYITNSHPAYIESIYNDYLKNPQTVDPELKKFFEGFDFAITRTNGNGHAKAAPATGAEKEATAANVAFGSTIAAPVDLRKEFGVFELIRAYRKRAHLIATTNPIRPRIDRKPHLDLSEFGLGDADMDTEFYAGDFIGLGKAKLKDIYAKLHRIYAGNIGIQYTYMNRMEAHMWVQNRFEELREQKFTLNKVM